MKKINVNNLNEINYEKDSILILGGPSAGKTTSMIEIANNFDVNSRTLFCSYELPISMLKEKLKGDNIIIKDSLTIEELKDIMETNNFNTVFIDYLQLLELKSNLNKNSVLNELTKLNTKLIVASQLSDNSEINDIYENYFDEIILLNK